MTINQMDCPWITARELDRIFTGYIVQTFLEMALKYFFLADERFFQSRNKLKGNPRILKFDPVVFWLRQLPTPTPSYDSLKELIQRDDRFKQFKKERPTTATLIAKEENIVQVKEMIFTGSYDHSQAGRMLLHLVEGTRKRKEFTGLHHFTNPLPDYVVDFKIVEAPNDHGVYTASFKIREPNGKLLSKENLTTLFPMDWDRQRLYDECHYALVTRVPMEDKRISFRSFTLCGIPVEIHFDNHEEKIRTLYPIRI